MKKPVTVLIGEDDPMSYPENCYNIIDVYDPNNVDDMKALNDDRKKYEDDFETLKTITVF